MTERYPIAPGEYIDVPARPEPARVRNDLKRANVEVRAGDPWGVWLCCTACSTGTPAREKMTADYIVRWADAHLCEVPRT